ncbi:MAG: hypothetical protein ACOYM2_18935 [Rectinemataceae bacterium]
MSSSKPSVAVGKPPWRDGNDQVFIELTLATGAVHLVNGDRDLLDYPSHPGLSSIAPSRLKDLVGS